MEASIAKLAHRGPDASRTERVGHATLGFHRLAIVNGARNAGMQPMRIGGHNSRWVLLCNGEIYNHETLAPRDACLEPSSDVDAILWMLEEHMLEEHMLEVPELASRLDGDFAFVAYDSKTGEFVAARDPVGVRPLFYAVSIKNTVIAFASEAKALCGLIGIKDVRVFPPGHTYSSKTGRFEAYYHPRLPDPPNPVERTRPLSVADLMPETDKWGAPVSSLSLSSSPEAAKAVRAELGRAVQKRLDHGDVSDVVGVLCSGGVDSAAITCIAHEVLKGNKSKRKRKSKSMRVFTMKYRKGRSDDAFYAGLLCAYLGVDHRTFEFGPEDLQDIDATATAVIRACETCDPNTIRAAIPMYLLAKAIKAEAPEVKVVLSGEGADELFGGYNYFRLAPDAASASAECDRLLKNLHMFDLLRADRCFAAHGLEVRVPFLDPALIDCVRSGVSAERRVSGEKQLLRDAVSDIDALFRFRILDRAKEKFSDGAGFSYVPDLLRRIAADAEGGDDGTLDTRLAAEKAFYRRIFDREFGAAGPCREEWVVERELPKWKEVEARRAHAGGGARFGMTD